MVSAANPNDIEKAKQILKSALARPASERLARLKASGIVDADGQIAAANEPPAAEDVKHSNGAKPTNGKHA